MARPDSRHCEPANYRWWCELYSRFGDMDVLGHLNNVAICRHFEDARTTFYVDLFGLDAIVRPGQARLLIVESDFHYLREAYYPGQLRVGCAVRHIGNSSFAIIAAMFQNDICAALNECTMVMSGREGSVPLGDETRARLDRYRTL